MFTLERRDCVQHPAQAASLQHLLTATQDVQSAPSVQNCGSAYDASPQPLDVIFYERVRGVESNKLAQDCDSTIDHGSENSLARQGLADTTTRSDDQCQFDRSQQNALLQFVQDALM